jgi:hypothetical protein
MLMQRDPLERVVWDTRSTSVQHRLRLDVAQFAHDRFPRNPTRRPTDLLVLVEVAEEVPVVRVARLDPGHLRGAVGSRREQAYVVRRGFTDVVLDNRLMVHVLLSWVASSRCASSSYL